jgi:hypothetical protein
VPRICADLSICRQKNCGQILLADKKWLFICGQKYLPTALLSGKPQASFSQKIGS